jgi:LysM repeat protein
MASRAQQFTILIAVVALGILGAAIIGVAYFFEQVVKPETMALQTIKQQQQAPDSIPDPGAKEYEVAIGLLKEGEVVTARDRFAYVMRYYPESAKFAEAKRVLGEINLDLLLSDVPAPGKIKYVVKSGDAGLAAIASRHKTTVDYIVRANGLSGNVIHPGDEYWLAPLIFVLEARMAKRELVVYRVESPELASAAKEATGPTGTPVETFFKAYPILDANLPPTVKVPSSADISDKPAWLANGRRAAFGNASYHAAHRWLQTSRPGLVIQAAPEDPETASIERKSGILLAPADINELYTYIRTGTELRLSE